MSSIGLSVTESGAAQTARARIDIWKWAQTAYVTLFLAILYAPIIILILLSFNDSANFGLPFNGFTLKWFSVVLADSAILSALVNSFTVGILSAVIAVALALGLALAFRRNFHFKPLILQIILIPV